MAEVWNVPGSLRPSFASRLVRRLAFLVVLGAGVVATGFLSSYGLVGRHGVAAGVATEVGSAAANAACYLAAFRILTPSAVTTSWLVPGACAGGLVWTAVEAAGGYLVTRDLRHETAIYGLFGAVLGLLAWIYLGCRVSLYAAVLNVVVAFRLWPRSLAPPPLTAADERALALLAEQGERRPEERVAVAFVGAGRTPDRLEAARRWAGTGLGDASRHRGPGRRRLDRGRRTGP